MAEAQDEHVVDVAFDAYSLPAHAVHVSVAASAYAWPTAHAVHVLASLHMSQLPIADAQDEHVVDVVVAAYSVPAHAVHVSVAASVYLWPAAHAVHVPPSLHASQLPMAVAHDEHVVDVVVAAYSLPPHAVHVSVTASAYLWPTAHAVHVARELHALQPGMAEAQVAGAVEFRK